MTEVGSSGAKEPEGFPAVREGAKRELLVSKIWLQAVVLVFLIGFFILGLLA